MSYSRVNIFIEHLNFLQGKIEPPNSENLINEISNLINVSQIDSSTNFKLILKKLNKQQYYEYTEWIKRKYNLETINLNSDLEQSIINRYKTLFESNKETIRKLSYHFITYKLLQEVNININVKFSSNKCEYYEELWNSLILS